MKEKELTPKEAQKEILEIVKRIENKNNKNNTKKDTAESTETHTITSHTQSITT